MSDRPPGSAAVPETAIRLAGVGKMYRIYPSRLSNLLDAVGMSRLLAGPGAHPREFWALRGIDLEIKSGSRMGIVGRNGAGKTTLLKLITGNLPLTEGSMEIEGPVHALIEAGAGFHPEFTGVENMRAALTFQGLNASQMEVAMRDIAEFTELGPFLAQPYRTYSAGMQARLAFATATAIFEPKILIIDEMLGAGDAYFISKCTERMRTLVKGGATVILVSHSMQHITTMCDEAMWIDRGRIVRRGEALEVVKAYMEFLRVLENRRLKAKNRKVHDPRYHPTQYDNYSDNILVQVFARGPVGGTVEVAELALFRSGELEERLLVGQAQDADPSHASFVLLDAGEWSTPRRSAGSLCRGITVGTQRDWTMGVAGFNLYSVYEGADYALDFTYRVSNGARAVAETYRNGILHDRFDLEPGGGDWVRTRLQLGRLPVAASAAPKATSAQIVPAVADEGGAEAVADEGRRQARWPGEGHLKIEWVRLLDDAGRETAVFDAGGVLRLEIGFRAAERGCFDVIPAAVLYRLDGVLVCRYVGERLTLEMEAEEVHSLDLRIDPLRFGNAYYVFTVALYRVLDLEGQEEARFYDLVDRSYEFSVQGMAPLLDGVFHEAGRWSLERAPEVRPDGVAGEMRP